MGKERLSCVDCAVRACRGKDGGYPEFCLTTHLDPALRQEALDILSGPENAITVAAAGTSTRAMASAAGLRRPCIWPGFWE